MQRVLSLLSLICLLATTSPPSLIGDWTMDGQPDVLVTFFSDGTYHDTSRGRVDVGPYQMSDDQTTLTVNYHGHPYSGKLSWIDDNTVRQTIRFFLVQKTFTFHRVSVSTANR